jgi:hypothetical protein
LTNPIAQIPAGTKISNGEGRIEQGRFYDWTRQVTEMDIIVGTGSPEGVVEAAQKRLYMDSTGASGAVLYIKRDADVAGDRKSGWIAV